MAKTVPMVSGRMLYNAVAVLLVLMLTRVLLIWFYKRVFECEYLHTILCVGKITMHYYDRLYNKMVF